jgi:Ca2+-binding EF-hand superfamily protein
MPLYQQYPSSQQ